MVILHGGSSSTCPPPPSAPGQHVVHLHVNPGETVSLQMGGQVQVIQGTVAFKFFSNRDISPVPATLPMCVHCCMFYKGPLPPCVSVVIVLPDDNNMFVCVCVVCDAHGRGELRRWILRVGKRRRKRSNPLTPPSC
jgi:hypothetical protein